MNRFWFFTLKHTGTHFSFAHFEEMGFIQGRIDVCTGNITHQGHFIHLHVEEPNHLPIQRYDGGPVVVTMRDPVQVHISWLARYGVAESTTEALVKSYEKYQEVVDKLNPLIFRVDASIIQWEVERLADYLRIHGIEPKQDYRYKYLDPMEHRGHRGRRHNFTDAFKYSIPREIETIALQYGYTSPTREQAC